MWEGLPPTDFPPLSSSLLSFMSQQTFVALILCSEFAAGYLSSVSSANPNQSYPSSIAVFALLHQLSNCLSLDLSTVSPEFGHSTIQLSYLEDEYKTHRVACHKPGTRHHVFGRPCQRLNLVPDLARVDMAELAR